MLPLSTSIVPVTETLLTVPAFVPASAPTNCEFRPFTVTSVRLRLRTMPVRSMVPNSPTLLELEGVLIVTFETVRF